MYGYVAFSSSPRSLFECDHVLKIDFSRQLGKEPELLGHCLAITGEDIITEIPPKKAVLLG